MLILGGPGRATLETEIYNQAARLFDLRAAAALSLLQLGAVAIVLGVRARSSGGLRSSSRAPEHDVLRRPRGRERFAVAGVLGVAAVALALPLAVLVERSLATPDGFGLGFYRLLARRRRRCSSPPWQAAVYSLAFAAAATAIALVVGGLAAPVLARRRGVGSTRS